MRDDLRDVANRRYREQAEHRLRQERTRRNLFVFVWSLTGTTGAVLTMQAVVRALFRPTSDRINKGLE